MPLFRGLNAPIAVLVFAVACGGTQTTDTKQNSERDAATPSSTTDAAAAGPSDATVAVNSGLTAADCERLVDHVLQIAIIAHNKKEDPKYQPTKQQIDQIRTKLRAELAPACLEFGRETYACVMKATDRAGYARCGKTGD